MTIILFALVQSRNDVYKPVTWIYFEITFTPTGLWKNLKNSTKTLKVALNMKKKQNYFKSFLIVYLTAPRLTLRH